MDGACACAGTGRERKAEGRASSGLCSVPHAHSTLSLDSRVSSPPRAAVVPRRDPPRDAREYRRRRRRTQVIDDDAALEAAIGSMERPLVVVEPA